MAGEAEIKDTRSQDQLKNLAIPTRAVSKLSPKEVAKGGEIEQKVWYHGTNVEGIDEIGIREAERMGLIGGTKKVMPQAIFFTESRKLAEFFAKNRYDFFETGKPTVYERYLSTKKVADMTTPAKIDKIFKELGINPIDYLADYNYPGQSNKVADMLEAGDTHISRVTELFEKSKFNKGDFVDRLKAAGYDAARMKEKDGISLAIFDPKQASKLSPKEGGISAGGMTKREIPEQIKRWLEKGVTITERMSPIKIVEAEPKIKDISGKTVSLIKGHEMTPYKLSNGNIWLHDGKDVVINQGQLQNLANKNIKLGGNFAPELEGVVEVVKGGDTEYYKKLSQRANEIKDRLQNRNLSVNEQTRLSSELRGIQLETEGERGTTKFSQYQLPGGENYREVLIKAPYSEQKQADYLAGKSAEKDAYFKSSHWDEPNVLSHLRLNDRTTPDGKKVLFIEELQSDWAREARKSPIERSTSAEMPSHPLLKNWQELSLKRALKEAVEKGYDYISWTTGEQQAERYDLGKQIDRVIAKKIGDNEFVITATKDGRDIIPGEEIPGDKLANYVGKDLAVKIQSDLSIKRDANTPGSGKKEYSGLDLKIGGEWAKNLYDRQVPNILKDLTKGEVGDIQVTTTPDKKGMINALREGGVNTEGLTNEEINSVIEEGKKVGKYKGLITQPALKITPEIKLKISGQPMAGGMTPMNSKRRSL